MSSIDDEHDRIDDTMGVQHDTGTTKDIIGYGPEHFITVLFDHMQAFNIHAGVS